MIRDRVSILGISSDSVWSQKYTWDTKGVTELMHQTATAEIALRYWYTIITETRTVNKEVIVVKENESWVWLKIYAVNLMWFMGQGTEGPQAMQEVFEAENKGIVIRTQV